MSTGVRKKAVLYRMVLPKHICPYGLKSKFLLKLFGYDVEDHLLTSRDQTQSFKNANHVSATPQTYIHGYRVGGYEDLKSFFSKATGYRKERKTVIPIIFVSVTALLVAVSISNTIADAQFDLVRVSLGIFISLLAMLKLQDLEGFTAQFLNYDLLARKFVPYAYIYPFAELLAGIGMISQKLWGVVAPISVLLGLIGATSVIKAVYIEHRDLECACVGGGKKVPLGILSLAENVTMIVMGIWMFLIHE